MSNSDSSSHSSHSGHKSFRQATRERLLHEMLRSTRGADVSDWKVLIMDEFTVKVMSNSCKMADITDEGISLVEDLNKRRQPLPALEAVYFIQPKTDSVKKFKMDMSGKSPLYKKAYVFFSSPVSREIVQGIKSDMTLLSRIAALREMNLEYLTVDSQAFSTDNWRALEQLFGGHGQGNHDDDACLETIATRLGTVFTSLKEFPVIRYRAARSVADAATATTFQDLVPTKLAAALWDRLQRYKNTLPTFPATETCELVIVDRSVDPIAPIIHEWTYEAMCHDLLNMEGNKYSYEITTSTGRKERKEVLLEEHDPLWVELRHLFIADVSMILNERLTLLKEKNKAAQIRAGTKDGHEVSTRELQKMVQDLPQYRDQIERLSLHIDIATCINDKITEYELIRLGHLEQDLVFGDASSKELINMLTTKQDITKENKLRLLMVYAASHPEKLDAAKRQQWMKLARLTEEDMLPVVNMEYLGVSVAKKHSGGFSLKFGNRKNKRAIRKERNQDEEAWKLSRFCPALQEVIEDLAKGELSNEDYPYVKEPPPAILHSMSGDSGSVRTANSKPAQSMRTSKPNSTWATKTRPSDDGQLSGESSLRHAHSDPKITGKRIFVFVVGGATRSELRAVHKLTASLRREVVLGTTSLDEPHEFLTKLKLMSAMDDVTLEDLEI